MFSWGAEYASRRLRKQIVENWKQHEADAADVAECLAFVERFNPRTVSVRKGNGGRKVKTLRTHRTGR